MNLFRLAASCVMLVLACSLQAQCDPEAVDFGEATWGLSPDGETTFFDTAYVSVAYVDEVHLLVPSFAIDVVPDTPLNAPIDSVVIEAVLLVDTVAGDTLTFEDVVSELPEGPTFPIELLVELVDGFTSLVRMIDEVGLEIEQIEGSRWERLNIVKLFFGKNPLFLHIFAIFSDFFGKIMIMRPPQ